MADYLMRLHNRGDAGRAGAPVGTVLAEATLQPFTEVLNGAGAIPFHMPLFDAQTPLVTPLRKEVSIERDGLAVAWGPVTTRRWSNGGAVAFGAEGPLAYFAMRNIDRGAGRRELLTNPDFEDSSSVLTGWTATNTVATVNGTHRVGGANAAKLTTAAADQDSYLAQQVVLTAGTVGEVVTLAFHFWIDPIAWIGPAFEERGLYLAHIGAGNVLKDQPAIVRITSETPRGAIQRVEVEVKIPAGATETLDVRLYGPGGAIWWDGMRRSALTLMESLSSYDTDQATIAARVAQFIQDPTYGWANNLNISTDTPPTGVLRDAHWQFADHTTALGALAELRRFADGIDYSVTLNRFLRTHYPSQGTDRSANVTLRMDDNVVLRGESFDGAQAADRVVELGMGDGPDREEGFAVDTAVFDDLGLQSVLSPPQGVTVGQLNSVAARQLEVSKRPHLYRVGTVDPQFTTQLGIGDVVTADFAAYPAEPYTGRARIVAKTTDPHTDLCDLDLNRVA